MLDFLKENSNFILPLVVFLFGWILPVPHFKLFGKQVGEQLPPKVRKLLADRLKAFQRGLEEADVKGDTNLVDNETVRNELKKVKLDLGLKE